MVLRASSLIVDTLMPIGRQQVYIITTKSQDLTIRLLARCGVSIPDERVFGLGSGSKV